MTVYRGQEGQRTISQFEFSQHKLQGRSWEPACRELALCWCCSGVRFVVVAPELCADTGGGVFMLKNFGALSEKWGGELRSKEGGGFFSSAVGGGLLRSGSKGA